MNHPVGQTALIPYTPPSAAMSETSSTAAAAMATASIQARYVMAFQRPRNWDDVRVKVLADCKRPTFAEVAEYARPVGREQVNGQWVDKLAKGPSIRFVEAALRHMGNVDTSTMAIFDDAEKRIVRVTVIDLEGNLTSSKEITATKTVERLSLKKGEVPISTRLNSRNITTYLIAANDDQVSTKEGALVSKAIRELGKRIIPGDLVQEAMDLARATRADATAKDPSAARKRLADSFADMHVMPSGLAEYLGHDIGGASPAEIEELRGLYAAIRDGDTSWSEVLDARRAERGATADAKPGEKPATVGAERAAKVKAPKSAPSDATKEAPPSPPIEEPEWMKLAVGSRVEVKGEPFEIVQTAFGKALQPLREREPGSD